MEYDTFAPDLETQDFASFVPYKKQWSEFEVQALAYGILRKQLYPNYLVRGEYAFKKCRVDIAIFKPQQNKDPELVCVIEVKKRSDGTSDKQGTRYEEILGVPCLYIRGGQEAYDVLNRVSKFL